MNMIEVKDVSICFRMANDKLNSLKEFMIQKVKGKLKYEEFWALKDVSFNVKKGEVVGIVGQQRSRKKYNIEGNLRDYEAYRGNCRNTW